MLFGLKRRNPYMGGSGLASAVMTVFRCGKPLGAGAQAFGEDEVETGADGLVGQHQPAAMGFGDLAGNGEAHARAAGPG